jgi:hypothetical protein
VREELVWRSEGRAGFESPEEASRRLSCLQRLKLVEGAEFLVRREDADPVAELGRQLREEGDTAIGAAIVYECVGQCDAKSCL